MRFLALIKRFIPFFLTFALGLFIASFFVSVAAPNLNIRSRGFKNRDYHRLRYENERLRERVRRLESERLNNDFDLDINVPPPPPMPPPPPPTFSVPRRDR
jgi:hypothetical protein